MTRRYFLHTYEDGSVMLDLRDAPVSTVRELTREEAIAFYCTAPSIDAVEASIAAEFEGLTE